MANTKSFENEKTQYASITDADQTGLDFSGDFTFETWIKFENLYATSNYNRITGKFGTTRGWEIFMYNSGGSKLRVIHYDSSATERSNLFSWSPSVDTWYHLAVVFDTSNSDLLVYVNGSQLGSTATIGASTNDSDGDVQFGTYADVTIYGMDGFLDETIYWSDVRTPTEISESYNSGDGKEYVGNEANMEGYWRFENDFTDETSNGNTLTNNGAGTFSTSVPFSGSTGPTYTMTASAGSFTLTGKATSLEATRKLSTSVSSFTLTGYSAGLTYTVEYKLTANTGTFTLTGEDATLSQLYPYKWTYEQDFDSLTDGDLNGQDSWVSTVGKTDVDSEFKFLGTKGLELTGDGYAQRTIPDIISGDMYFALKYYTPSSSPSTIKIDDGTNDNVFLNFVDDGNSATYSVQMYTDAGYQTIATGLSKYYWYIWNIDFDNVTDMYSIRYKTPGNLWGSWSATYSYYTATTNLNRLRLDVASGGVMHIDEISASDPYPIIILDASRGIFTLTGNNTNLNTDRKLTAGIGDFALTGNDTTLTYSRVYDITAELGEFTLTGISTNLLLGKKLPAETSSFVLTGFTATLTKTGVSAPTVTTQACSSIRDDSFVANGTITATGGLNATRRGFCYFQGSSGDPTIADSVKYEDGDFGVGAFNLTIDSI